MVERLDKLLDWLEDAVTDKNNASDPEIMLNCVREVRRIRRDIFELFCE